MNRSPGVTVFYPEEEPNDTLKGKRSFIGLDEVAHHGAADDESRLFFVGDSDRVKSYSFWDDEQNARREELLPIHTLDSEGFESAIGALPNGRLARAGRGSIALWNLNELPTHQTAEGGIIGEDLGDDDEEEPFSSRRVDTENIERSSGSLPHSVFRLSERNLMISGWHNHPTARATMLISTNDHNNSQFYCRALDLEQEGKCVTRYIGHGGEINEFSTSKGDPNVFVTAANDGFARLFDVRNPLPVLTIAAGVGYENCSSAALCHPDGIPCTFMSSDNPCEV